MTSLSFKRGDVEGLAEKLAGSKPPLTPTERNLLLAIFSVARKQVSEAGPLKPEDEATSQDEGFSQQLIDSFLPDSGTDFIIPPRHGGVQPGIVRPSQPVPSPEITPESGER
jgi:hypothetical protein